MNRIKSIVLSACVMFAITSAANASHLEKRHQLGLKLVMWNQIADVRSEFNNRYISSSVGSDGFLGSINYGYWITEGFALNVSAGVMMAKVNSTVNLRDVLNTTASITQVLVSAKSISQNQHTTHRCGRSCESA